MRSSRRSRCSMLLIIARRKPPGLQVNRNRFWLRKLLQMVKRNSNLGDRMSTTPLLVIEDLHVTVADKPILKGLTLTLQCGEVHVLLGQNGTGKSTLAYAIAGHPNYKVTQGKILVDGKDLLAMEADARARAGVFLAFQAPISVPGVSVANFLRTAYQARFHGTVV